MSHKPISEVLDAEFIRVSTLEDISLEELVEELSSLTGYSTRHLYNYRKGKWPLPSSIVPILCIRFKSRALVAALDGTIEPVRSTEEFGKLALQATKESCNLHYAMIDAYRDGASAEELAEFQVRIEKIRSMEQRLLALLEQAAESEKQEKAG